MTRFYETRMADLGRMFVCAILFVMPSVAVTVDHGASTLFYLLVLPGLVLGWPAWRMLEPEEKWLLRGWIAIFLVAVLSWWNTDDPVSFRHRLEAYGYFVLAIPPYLMMRRYSMPAASAMLAGFLPAGFVMLGVALFDRHVLELERATGAYHFNVFGLIAALVASVLVAQGFQPAQSPVRRMLNAAGTLAALWATVLSETRGAWLILPVSIIVVILTRRRSVGRRGWTLLGGLSLITIVLLVVATPPTVERRLSEIFRDLRLFREQPEVVTPVGERLHMWRDSLVMFSESPIVGTGIGDYHLESERLMEQGRSRMVRAYPHAHNAWLHSLAINGILGMLTMTIVWLVLPATIFVRRLNQPSSASPLAGLLTLTAYAVFGLTNIWISSPLITFYLVSMMAYLLEAATHDDRWAVDGNEARD